MTDQHSAIQKRGIDATHVILHIHTRRHTPGLSRFDSTHVPLSENNLIISMVLLNPPCHGAASVFQRDDGFSEWANTLPYSPQCPFSF